MFSCFFLDPGHFANNWMYYTLLTELPTYYNDIFNLDVKAPGSGLYYVLPFILLAIGCPVAGKMYDVLMKRGYLSVSNARKVAMFTGLVGSGAVLVLQASFRFNETATVVLMTVAVAIFANTSASYGSKFLSSHLPFVVFLFPISNTPCCTSFTGPNFFELSPAGCAGMFYAISNTFATLPGIISPLVCAALLPDDKSDMALVYSGWSAVFYINCGISFAGTLWYWIFASSKLVPTLCHFPSVIFPLFYFPLRL